MTKIRLGIVGCGSMSVSHARRMKGISDVQIVSVCDLNMEFASNYVENNLKGIEPRPVAYGSMSEMLAETKLDAVVIATPHILHFQHGMQALDTGCHVLMEKPMVISAEHAYMLAEKVRAVGKVFVVGYNTPCTANFYFLRECIRNQVFGELELVSAYLTQNWKSATRGSWRQDPKIAGGGQAFDSGAHLLNGVCWSVESKIAEVHAFVDNQDTPVDVNSSINIRFESGVFAGIVISGNSAKSGSHSVFVFENGRIEIDGWNGNWIRVWEGSECLDPPTITDDMSAGSPDQNFVEAILGHAEARTSVENGIIHCELMDAIYESDRTGQPVRPNRR